MARPKICGIYAIHSAVNDRIYIGHSANILRRWPEHRCHLRKDNHHCIHLQRAWNKYGEEAFEFSILEECAVELLLEREQFHMDQYSDKYNCSLAAESRRGVPNSPETRKKISVALTGRVIGPAARANMSAALIGNTRPAGRSPSPETRAKLSERMMGNTNCVGSVLSPEHRENLSAALRGVPKSEETKRRMSAAQTGRKASPEARARMSEAAKRRAATPEGSANLIAAREAKAAARRSLPPEDSE